MSAWDAVSGPAKAAVSEFLGNIKSAKRTFIPHAGSVVWLRDEAINAYNDRNDVGFDGVLCKLFDMIEKCPRCKGSGKYDSIQCALCSGTGLMRESVDSWKQIEGQPPLQPGDRVLIEAEYERPTDKGAAVRWNDCDFDTMGWCPVNFPPNCWHPMPADPPPNIEGIKPCVSKDT